MYKYILFDLDGTITDPKMGITKAAQYALKQFNIFEEDLNELEKFIGPPLLDSFQTYYGMSESETLLAIDEFRVYFKAQGIFENIPYKGIEKLLQSLQEEYTLAIATSKPTVFAKQILDHFNLSQYFETIIGSHLDNTRTDKKEVIEAVLETLKIKSIEECIMIGDRKHDLIGAKKLSMDCIGVTYGYGSLEELENEKPVFLADTLEDLQSFFSHEADISG